ncbi:MAG: hypothetical protein AAF296_02960 [Pseudomonadota bacterium]
MEIDFYRNRETGTHINKLGLNNDLLAMKMQEMADAATKDINILGTFDSRHISAIHRHMFKDVFFWAGEMMSLPPAINESSARSYAHMFDRQVAPLRYIRHGVRPDAFAERVGATLSKVAQTPPFYLGTDHALRGFTRLLAKRAGYNWDRPEMSAGRRGQWGSAWQEANADNPKAMIDFVRGGVISRSNTIWRNMQIVR